MKSARKKNALISFLLLLSVFYVSCTTGNPLQKQFGADADYFIGLSQLKNGQENEAREKFKRCIKKGTSMCVRKSYEALCSMGSMQERTQTALDYASRYNDTDAILIAARQLKTANEISRLIEITEQCNLADENNEIIKLRMEALKQRGASSYENEVFQWFTSRPVSSEHYQFYRDTYNHPFFSDDLEASPQITTASEQPHTYTPEQFAINYRIELYKRDYSYTFSAAQTLLEYFEKGVLQPNEQLASDLGKAYLYGSTNFAQNASLFAKLAGQYKDTPLEYFFWFYTGRLLDKAGFYYQQTKSSFENAARTANTSAQKDNALWYLLVSSLNFSLESITDDIKTCSRQWNDPEYFEDFFESLISSLLASGKWNLFGDIYKAVDGYASNLTVAQYAYLYGRLIQENLAKGSSADCENAFRRALNSGTSPYYKVLAAYHLGLTGSDLEAVLLSSPKNTSALAADAGSLAGGISYVTVPASATPAVPAPLQTAHDAEILLRGYASFGFPELIYPTWQKLDQSALSAETCFFISDFLNRCSTGNDDYLQQSLRIASRTANGSDSPLTKQQLRQIYPRNYSKYIEEFSKKYELPSSIVYALVRSESFFDPDVVSSAGAIGLTQLMEFTGGDIARKLKESSYDLTNPETNLRFGTYYLSELVRRCDGSLLQGFFSYNAGITRVRRWVQSSMIEFGKKENMPVDLFLETVPYAETREYGRKLAGASVMYEWLYNENPDENFTQIIEKMIK